MNIFYIFSLCALATRYGDYLCSINSDFTYRDALFGCVQDPVDPAKCLTFVVIILIIALVLGLGLGIGLTR